MNDLDKLATAMGYVKISNYTGSFADQQGTEHWTHPDGYVVFEVPDPENDANDCNSLIKHLNGLHWDLNIWFSGNADSHRSNVAYRVKGRFRDGSKGSYEIPCDNWMHGVCELALKVIK